MSSACVSHLHCHMVVHKDGVFFLCYRSTIRRWMKLASAFTESPIRVKALDWPLQVSPAHGLQLQVTAALKALGPVKPRHQPVSISDS